MGSPDKITYNLPETVRCDRMRITRQPYSDERIDDACVLTVSDVVVMGTPLPGSESTAQCISRGKRTAQSSNYAHPNMYGSQHGVDGNRATFTHTNNAQVENMHLYHSTTPQYCVFKAIIL